MLRDHSVRVGNVCPLSLLCCTAVCLISLLPMIMLQSLSLSVSPAWKARVYSPYTYYIHRGLTNGEYD